MTAEDTPFSNTLSGSDINGDTLSFTVSTLPIHGIVNVVGSTFTYTPTANYNGTDSFIYKVFDGSLYSTGASIDFTITPVPDPPVAVNDSFSPLQDTPLFLPVMNNDYDVDSASGLLSLTGFTNPTNGTISTTATGFLYTPNMSYFGADSFTYRLIDETALLSNIATVNLNVTSSNMPPVASGSTFSLNEDSVFTGSLPAYDPESATLTYRINTLPTQ